MKDDRAAFQRAVEVHSDRRMLELPNPFVVSDLCTHVEGASERLLEVIAVEGGIERARARVGPARRKALVVLVPDCLREPCVGLGDGEEAREVKRQPFIQLVLPPLVVFRRGAVHALCRVPAARLRLVVVFRPALCHTWVRRKACVRTSLKGKH